MNQSPIPKKAIKEKDLQSKIYVIRGKKIMLDEDLAELYGIPTKRLNEQVKRNISRFPSDFMFKIEPDELNILKSQIATSRWGGRRTLPFAFTEHGVLMLSSVISSETAIQVNIHIMRVYTRMREAILANQEILLKIEQIEKGLKRQQEKGIKHDEEIDAIFDILKQLIQTKKNPAKRIGFR